MRNRVIQPNRVKQWLERHAVEIPREQPQEVLAVEKKIEVLEMPAVRPPRDMVAWRMMAWLGVQIVTPSYRRWASWWAKLPFRLRLFVRALSKGKVSKRVYDIRMDKCSQCKHAIKRLKVKKGAVTSSLFCFPCRCPEWWGSELHRKNWLQGWECPDRRHPGPYRDDLWRDLVTNVKSGGCGGGD